MLIGRLATLYESVQHVDFAVEAADYVGDLLAEDVDLRNKSLSVVDTADENLILDCFGLALRIPNKRLEAVDDIVSRDELVINPLKGGLVSRNLIKHTSLRSRPSH